MNQQSGDRCSRELQLQPRVDLIKLVCRVLPRLRLGIRMGGVSNTLTPQGSMPKKKKKRLCPQILITTPHKPLMNDETNERFCQVCSILLCKVRVSHHKAVLLGLRGMLLLIISSSPIYCQVHILLPERGGA